MAIGEFSGPGIRFGFPGKDESGKYIPNPFDLQVEFLKRKLDLPTATWRDIWQSAHDRSFVVAGAMKADLLADLHAAVVKAAEEGRGIEDFRRDFNRIVKARGWHGWTGEGTKAGEAWRTRVIYQTNMTASHAAGRWAQINDPELAAFRPYIMYHHADGVAHPRPQHLAWNGRVLPKDHPFWATHAPPNGWGCRCYLTAAGKKDYERAKAAGKTEPPAGWNDVSEKTGAPVGIDKGWAYNPGASRAEALQRFAREKAGKLPGPIGEALLGDVGATVGKRGNRPLAATEAAATDTAKLAKVSDALELPKSGVGRKAAEAALAEIDAIHRVTGLPKIPVENSAASTSMYRFIPGIEAPTRIQVTKRSSCPELDAAHEIGHFIDHQSINGQRGYASIRDPIMQEWRAAVENSRAVAGLIDNLKRGGEWRRNADYYLRAHEAWARSYAQYIAERGGNAKMKTELAAILRDSSEVNQFRHWDADDFAPIAQAIDKLFTKLGWVK